MRMKKKTKTSGKLRTLMPIPRINELLCHVTLQTSLRSINHYKGQLSYIVTGFFVVSIGDFPASKVIFSLLIESSHLTLRSFFKN